MLRMEIQDLVADMLKVMAIYPDTVFLPIDDRACRQLAIGIDEHRNSAACQRFIKTVGPVSVPAQAKRVIVLINIRIKVSGHLAFVCRPAAAGAILVPDQEAVVDGRVLREKLKCART